MTLCRGTLLGPPPTGHVPRFLDSGVFVSPVGGPSRSLLEVRGAPWVALPARFFFGFMCYVLGTKLGGVLLFRNRFETAGPAIILFRRFWGIRPKQLAQLGFPN